MTSKVVRKAGFTLIELLVALVISSILVGLSVSIYTLARKAIARDQLRADLTQNARVSLDRLSRELRQTPEVITDFPSSAADTSVSQPNEVQFEDGHANDLTYKRYYISGTILKVDTIEYYFTYDTSNRVRWNTVGTSGEAPTSRVITTQDIADNVASLTFYGNDLLQVIITTSGSDMTFSLRTTVLGRNSSIGRNP